MAERVVLTLAECAERYGVTEQEVRRMVAVGSIPHLKAGRRIVFPVAVLDEFDAELAVLAGIRSRRACQGGSGCGECVVDVSGLSGHQLAWATRASRGYDVCLSTLIEWASGWTCNICGRDVSAAGAACLDHCHKTGAPRGLLCRRCNLGMSFMDDLVWQRRAAAYLQP